MIWKKFLSLLLALSLLLSLMTPALAAETASVIRLTKTTGTVAISKSSGKSISLLKNMRLYNGYHVSTDEESYAWINLDDSKLLKEDAESEVEVRKDGKNLEVLVASGNIFFDVAEDLGDDESLNIRTSTMVVGIRGTSGWIQCVDRWVTRVSVLEGTVECSVADPVTGEMKAEAVSGGETVLCVVYPQEKEGDKSVILREKYTVDDIPGFVLTDLTRDIPLCDKIEAATDLDIPRDLASVAGGDPSGRTPEGDSATREVLGEADRREDEDEDDLHDRIEEVEKELEKQPGAVSPSKPVEKPAPAPSDKDSDRDSDRDSGGDSGGTTTPDPAPPEPEPEPPEPEPEPEPPTPPAPPPPTYTVTFNANGGTLAGPATMQTDKAGNLSSWPSAPTYGDPEHPPQMHKGEVNYSPYDRPDSNQLTFDGWEYEDGSPCTEGAPFTADTVLKARWRGWFVDSATEELVVTKDLVEQDYDSTFIIRGPDAQVFSSAPWGFSMLDGKVKTITIKGNPARIGNYALYSCSSLTSVAIPSGVTSIGSSAFEGSGLKSITIPATVTSIGNDAFSNCGELRDIFFAGTMAQWNNIENIANSGYSRDNVLVHYGS